MDFLLSVAGFDPTGGAGVLRDVGTFKYFGFPGAAAITVNTVQNAAGVKLLAFVDGAFLLSQVESILEEIRLAGVKVGVPHEDVQVNRKLGELLSSLSVPVVFDPVLSPTYGRKFVEELEILWPLVEVSTVLTPNYSEFLKLKELLQRKTFIVKGWPYGDKVCDVLFINGSEADRVCHEKDGRVVRGTGCAFSSALTALLAKGLSLGEAFRKAVNFITEYRRSAFEIEGAPQLYPSL